MKCVELQLQGRRQPHTYFANCGRSLLILWDQIKFQSEDDDDNAAAAADGVRTISNKLKENQIRHDVFAHLNREDVKEFEFSLTQYQIQSRNKRICQRLTQLLL